MSEPLRFHYDVNGKDFTSAGKASVDVKKNLRLLGLSMCLSVLLSFLWMISGLPLYLFRCVPLSRTRR